MLTAKHLTIKSFLLLAAVLMLLVACTPNTQAGAGETAVVRSITVIGKGEATGLPNQAQVQIGVEVFAKTVSQATDENETKLQAIMTALNTLGIAAEDIQTSNYGLWAEPRYTDQGPQGIAGYHVSNQVSVTIRDIDKVSDVLAAVTDAGANSIAGVSFSVDDPAALEAEAREKAVADARARAEILARLSGVELGEVIAISEVVGQPGLIVSYGGAPAMVTEAAAGGPNISSGQLSHLVQLQVTFGIK